MFGSTILDTAIGTMFVLILVSVVCSAIREGLEIRLKSRATFLNFGIRELLRDEKGDGLVRDVYEHPLVHGLYEAGYAPPSVAARFLGGTNLPSYVPSQNFARALLDIAARGRAADAAAEAVSTDPITLADVRANLRANIRNGRVQRALLVALDSAGDSLEQAEANVANWYDTAMDRVTGWYKRTTQWFLFAIGLVVAVSLNVNTVAIADYLYRNDTARAVLVARSEKLSKDGESAIPSGEAARTTLDELELPIGWSGTRRGPGLGMSAQPANPPTAADYYRGWVMPILGWLITAIAASMGAPFWFDLLSKFVLVRSTIKPLPASSGEATADREPRSAVGGESAVAARAAESAVPIGGGATAPAGGSTESAADADGFDGCDVGVADATPDALLPAATGGIA